MANTASRLITLIMLLQRQPNQTASQLAQALDVSVRTVQRYMTTLDDMGIPIYAERGPYGGYALVRGYKMPPLVFTPEETVAIYLGTSFLEQIWGRLYQEAARGALAKLDNVRIHDLRHTFASYGAGGGVGLPLIGGILGHRQASTTQRYAHLADTPLRAAADLISREITHSMVGSADLPSRSRTQQLELQEP